MRVPDEARLQRLAAETDESVRTANALALAMTRLRSRLRGEAGMHRIGLSLSQLSVLGWLTTDGPTTAARLATVEHVSQQAIAQSLATLKAEGFVASEPDPSDGRKTLLSATATGRELYETMLATRETWLIHAIATVLSDEERGVLSQAAELMERLASADPADSR
jgi:DNA-binding MarR family transcriptional regulator